MDKDKILNRWEEYISELYGDEERGMQPQSEIKHAISIMKRGKATGVD